MKAYHNGPIKQGRSCTDCFCFVIFIIFNVVMLGFGIYAWTSGDFKKLTTPYDADGKGCGQDVKDYPLIYFVSPHPDTLWQTVCVKECPKAGDLSLQCSPNTKVPSCSSNVQIYESSSLGNRVCVPTSQSIKDTLSSALGITNLDSKITNLGKAWVIIAISIPIAVILSLLFMLFIRLTAGCFVYLLIATAFVGLLAFGFFLIIPQSSPTVSIQSNKILSIVVGVLCILLATLILIAVCCFRKRISLAAAIIKVAAKFVNDKFLIILLPIILFAVMTLFIVLWILQALGYYSLGTPVSSEKQLPFQHFQTNSKIIALGVIHIFYLFWVLFFLVETGAFIISGASCSWYFRSEDPYSQSSQRYRKFHIGSVSLGSFFLALFGFLKFLYEILTPQKQEGCMGTWKKFCSCCCYLCVSFIFNWFNSGAYTMIHLSGESYCTSAGEAMTLRIGQPVSTAVVTFLTTVFSALSVIGITALTCFLSYVIMKNLEPYKSTVTDATIPLVVIGLIGFTISSFFVTLYSQAMTSIYVSYLADIKAGGSASEDKAPDELKQFLEEAKKQQKLI